MYKEEKIDDNWAEDYRYCRMCHKTSSRHVNQKVVETVAGINALKKMQPLATATVLTSTIK